MYISVPWYITVLRVKTIRNHFHVAASTGSISITVTDTNDQAPTFVPGSLFAAVAEEAPFGTTITTLEVPTSYSL